MKLKTKVIVGLLIVLALIFTFSMGENPTENEITFNKPTQKQEEVRDKSNIETEMSAIEIPNEDIKIPSEDVEISQNSENVCFISVRCDSVLNNLDNIKEDVLDIIPPDGIILDKRMVKFQEGESVFDVFEREMKLNNIHIEFSITPIYKSAYIEGIGNLYEFDCGELSGWLYKVNGIFPGNSSSGYIVNAGDIIEFVYTCDLGRDVGGYVPNGQRDE